MSSIREKFKKLLLQESRKQWNNEIASLGKGFVAPFRATPQDVVDTVIQRLNLTTDDILFDLGCGEGHWCISASKASGCQSIGIELSEEIAERARQRSLTELNSKQTNLVDIYVRDMLHPDGLMNIQDATVVIVYAGREATRKLAPILKRRLRSGTRVVSIHFAVPGWPTDHIEFDNKAKVYFYTIGSSMTTTMTSSQQEETKITRANTTGAPPAPVSSFSTPNSILTPPKWTQDLRIEPSIRKAWSIIPKSTIKLDIPTNRKECVLQAAAPQAVQSQKAMDTLFGENPIFAGGSNVQTKNGFESIESKFTSQPDGNSISVSIVRQKKSMQSHHLPIVVYFHGGGMAKASSFHGNFQTFARMIASHDVIVVLIDFRNSTYPARPGDDIGAYPSGLNDCQSGVRWVAANRSFVGGGSRSRIVLAGESGGGNLAIATALKFLHAPGAHGNEMNKLNISGIYAMCPFIGGMYPNSKYPSTLKYDGIILSTESMQSFVVGYGDDCRTDKYAWPSYCTTKDLVGLCPIVVSMNEFDPLVDEGKDFYRKCLLAGVDARGIVLSGTTHATDNYFPGTAPRIARATASAMACFAHGKDNQQEMSQAKI